MRGHAEWKFREEAKQESRHYPIAATRKNRNKKGAALPQRRVGDTRLPITDYRLRITD
jgi:hypothetical protein